MRGRLFGCALAALLCAGPSAAQDAAPPTPPFGGGATLSERLGDPPPPRAQPQVRRPARLLPTPIEPPAGDTSFPATSNAALGAFQRGQYLSALRIAEPLANMGDSAAQTLLGEIYLRGLGVPQDEEEAARWFRVASDAGDAQAQFRYAMMLIDGEGVSADPEAARDLMRRSADAGNPLAAFNYGQMLIRASPTGGFQEAYRYFKQAADAGVPDGQYALSQLYAYGQGVDQADDVTARRWLHAAAVRGHDTAQIELGIWLLNGRGGPADAPAGFRWLKGAAERGNPIAVNRLAHLYRDGIGTPRNADEAAKWTVIARRAGNSDAALDSFLRSLPEDQQRRALEAANRFQAG